MFNFSVKKNKGYTIIETMIAVSIFLILVVAGVGALLNANVVHNKSRDLRSILDNLNFIMEDMSRNLRTGYNFRCTSSWSSSDAGASYLDDPQSCEINGHVLIFEEAHGVSDPSNPNANDDQWVYVILPPSGGGTPNIYKSTNGGSSLSPLPSSLNGSEIVIDGSSGFQVLGAEKLPINKQQPLITIRLAGHIVYKNVNTPFALQTTISQRLIDVVPGS